MSSLLRLGRARAGLLVLALLVSGACMESAVQPEYPEDISFAASLGIDLSTMTKTSAGVYYLIKVSGTEGRVDNASRVSGDYKAWLPDGRQFGAGHLSAASVFEMISGLGYGMAGMQKGETLLIVIPSALAYGPTPPAELDIPRNSVLIYEMTVIDFI